MKPLRLPLILLLAMLLAACGGPAGPAASGRSEGRPAPQRTKSITIGVTGGVQAMSVVGSSTTSGGWHSVNDVHSSGLTTTDFKSRRVVGRLAENAPTLEDGSVSLLPDGRMRVVFRLRDRITWQDGTPFSADDLVFSHAFHSDRGVPSFQRAALDLMDSVEAPDGRTFVVYYKTPYYLGAALAVREFWPMPRHILGEPYERFQATRNVDEILGLPYWTSDYVHLGPFRLISFDPGEGTVYQAYEGYFLGKPKLDIIRVRTFEDPNTLFTNLLAGTVDILMDTALSTELGFQLKDRWDAAGDGTVYARGGSTRFLALQWRPSVQVEPSNLDPRVRGALYQAIDREALVQRELPAWSLLAPGDLYYEATKDALRVYPFDPERSKSILRDAGWTPGPDGALRHAVDGRRFRQAIWTTVGARHWEMSVYGDYWRRIGLEVEEYTIPSAQVRNLEFRAHFPAWEASSAGQGDAILSRISEPPATAQSRWVGERGGYENPRALELVTRYRTSLSERDQFEAMRGISDFVVAELPLLAFYYTVDLIGARKGVRALDDVEGGAVPAAPPFGTYTRNAHLWDLT